MRTPDSTVDAAHVTAAPPELSLLVISSAGTEMRALPRRGQLVLGRGETADVNIDDAQASREHARIEIGEALTITDLGSRNGTLLAGARLTAHEATPLAEGQSVEIGAALILIQRVRRSARAQKLVSHPYFEGRVEDAIRQRRAFSLSRIHLGELEDARRIEERAQRTLRADDVIAIFAPGELELMVFDRPGADVAAQLVEGLRGVKTATVRHPDDGHDLDALSARASDALFAAGRASSARGRAPERGDREDGPVIADPVMVELHRVVERVARGNISVLLLGETGAGKEVLAEAIHRASARKKAPFQRINCAAISETLFESELFGHEAGAFTGAAKARAGLLETAGGGTVFLDEIGELGATLQAKLLRAIEQRQITRLGSTEPRAIDVRFISATNRDLALEVEESRFRQDLYFRLNGISLSIPPLRERPREISLLARRFIERFSREQGRPVPELSARAEAVLLEHSWPGNVRELRNALERALLLAGDDLIDVEHLPLERMRGAARNEPKSDERARIIAALETSGGNQTKAAKLLGIGRRTLTTKLTQHQLPRPRK